jgi:hypothetical protein
MFFDHQFFRNKLYNYTNRVFDLVATIDHPYASPPIRLIDGHYKLKMLIENGLTPYICIWDATNPDVDRHRYDLIMDTGVFNTRDRNFYIFDDRILYPLQKPRLIDFAEIKKRVGLILSRLAISNSRVFLDNLEIVIDIYQRNIDKSINGTQFYQNLLSDFYTMLQFNDLAEFINKYSISYFLNSIITDWIPFCLKETKEESFGILSLFKKGLFKRRCFRHITEDKNTIIDVLDINNDFDQILSLLKSRVLIPSCEVFFWTLALADIKHFGNDYGFFNRLKQIFPNFSNQIQLTQHNQDSSYIVRFAKNRSFSCFIKNGQYVIQKNSPVKTSRISSIPAIFCHVGNYLGNIIRDILVEHTESQKIINMGEVYPYEEKSK